MNPTAGAVHRPHDLLWLGDVSALRLDGALPAWATPSWLAVAPVVVRRAMPMDASRVPVGLRGATRGERCAAHVAASGVTRAVTPEAIARDAAALPFVRGSALPCLRTLARLAPAMNDLPLPWGVTGSVGFTLASGVNVLRAESDLDVLVRTHRAADATSLRAIGDLLTDLPARVDVQVETAAGAFALQEWLRTGGPVLLKTNAGPRLVDDPWAP